MIMSSNIKKNDTNIWREKALLRSQSSSPTRIIENEMTTPNEHVIIPIKPVEVESSPGFRANSMSLPATEIDTIDVWQITLDVRMKEYELLGKLIEGMKDEIKLPIYLRGKSLSDKQQIMSEKIISKIKEIISSSKNEKMFSPSEENIQKIIDIMMTKQTLVTIFNDKTNDSIINAINFILNKEKECDKVEVASSRGTSVCEDEKDEVSTKVVKKPSMFNNFSQFKKFDNSDSYKDALFRGQEMLLNEFKLSKDEIDKINKDLSSQGDGTFNIHSVDIKNDKIIIDKHEFSKKHYLTNKWFSSQIINYYREYFDGFISVVKGTGQSTLVNVKLKVTL